MTLFDKLPHPFVASLASERDVILANAARPEWRLFLEEAARFFANREPSPPQFPAFPDDGGYDEVMAASVLAYVTKERKYQKFVAQWLRGLIEYFGKMRDIWENNLQSITHGLPPKVDPPYSGNPRQFFQGFTGNYYFTEGGLMFCVLHLLDMLEAHAPELLCESEKAQVQAALAHFAQRYAFHEEAVKYSNRGMWSNLGLLVAALCHEDEQAAAVLLQQARQRYHELRSTFLDDGSFAEGSWGYHLYATDAIICYNLLVEHAFGQSLLAGCPPSANDVYAGYPSMQKVLRAHTESVIAGETAWENPRGSGSLHCHLPVPLHPSLLYAYKINRDPHTGWIIERLRGQCRHTHVSSLRVTPLAILDLGSHTPLLNFWLDRPIDNAAALPAGMMCFPDFGGIISRGDAVRQARSTTWCHYGFLGTGKGHRDMLHVALSINGSEILADPFPRTGPPGYNSAMMHNTVVMDRADPPVTVGRLLTSLTNKQADAWLMENTGGRQPQRAFMHDPRAESRYWFDVDPVDRAGFKHQRAIIHFWDKALVIVDGVVADDGRSHRFDTTFHTLSPADEMPQLRGNEAYIFHQRSFIRGKPVEKCTIPTDPINAAAAEPVVLHYGGTHPFKLLAWTFGLSKQLWASRLSYPSGGPDVFAVRFAVETLRFQTVYAIVWDHNFTVAATVSGSTGINVESSVGNWHVDVSRVLLKCGDSL